PEIRKSGSPTTRARSLFGDVAAKNSRDRESKDIFQSLVGEATEKFFAAWGSVIESLGWSSDRSSGGNLGNHARQLETDGWESLRRSFFAGEINSIVYDVALTFRRLQTTGEARLIFGAPIAIQVNNEEHVLASIELESYTSGPKIDQVRRELIAFVESEETQYRAIEKLKELSDV